MSTPPSHTHIDRLPAGLRQRLDETIHKHIAAGTFPALALAAYHRGALILDAAWGWQNPESDQPLLTDHLFDLASVTKLFTATACLSLLSTGAAQLQTPLVRVLPEFGQVTPRPIDGGQDPFTKEPLPADPEFDGQQVNPEQVTLYHLLTHTSGLPPWRSVFAATEICPPPPDQPDTLTRQQRWQRALNALKQYAFVGQPDDIVRYSDIGLMLLGEAVSRLNGTPGELAATIQARVTLPLGVNDVLYNPVRDHGLSREHIVPTEIDAHWRERRVWGEVHDENACGVGGVAGHAGLFASAQSVAHLGEAWRTQPGLFGIDDELAEQAKREHAETNGNRRGLGFIMKGRENSFTGPHTHPDSYGHTGFTGTSLWIDDEAQIVLAMLTNRVYPGRERDGIQEARRDVHTLMWEGLTA